MEINRTFIVVNKKVNRTWELSDEIAKAFNINQKRVMRMCKDKGIDKVDESFRRILKQDVKNKVALFIWEIKNLKIHENTSTRNRNSSSKSVHKPKQLL